MLKAALVFSNFHDGFNFLGNVHCPKRREIEKKPSATEILQMN